MVSTSPCWSSSSPLSASRSAIADHAVHRRPQLVAHVGEEGGFRPVRRLGPAAGVAQPLHLPHLPGDVDAHRHHVAILAAPLDHADIGAVPHPAGSPDRAAAPASGQASGSARHRPGSTPMSIIPFFQRDGQDLGIRDAAADGGDAVEWLQPGRIGGDQPVGGVEHGETVADRRQRGPQPALGDGDQALAPWRFPSGPRISPRVSR